VSAGLFVFVAALVGQVERAGVRGASVAVLILAAHCPGLLMVVDGHLAMAAAEMGGAGWASNHASAVRSSACRNMPRACSRWHTARE
jgi:hypothetical protein